MVSLSTKFFYNNTLVPAWNATQWKHAIIDAYPWFLCKKKIKLFKVKFTKMPPNSKRFHFWTAPSLVRLSSAWEVTFFVGVSRSVTGLTPGLVSSSHWTVRRPLPERKPPLKAETPRGLCGYTNSLNFSKEIVFEFSLAFFRWKWRGAFVVHPEKETTEWSCWFLQQVATFL